jgi:hypothetical protein
MPNHRSSIVLIVADDQGCAKRCNSPFGDKALASAPIQTPLRFWLIKTWRGRPVSYSMIAGRISTALPYCFSFRRMI